MTTKILAVLALALFISACESTQPEAQPTPSPAVQSAATPASTPATETTPTAKIALKAGDKVKVTVNGSTVEATIVSIDDKASKAVVKVVGEDIPAFKFNTAVAKQMEALNDITSAAYQVDNSVLRKLIQVVAPFAPFTAEDCWHKIHAEGSVHASKWPTYDPALLIDDVIICAP